VTGVTRADIRRRAWRMRRDLQVGDIAPNAGHRALVQLERQARLRALLTQNIDGLHQQAGSSPASSASRSARPCRACSPGIPERGTGRTCRVRRLAWRHHDERPEHPATHPGSRHARALDNP
jgi:hypothetical protein